MLKSLIGGLLFVSLLLLGADKDPKDQGWKPTPMMRSVSPDSAKAGDQVTITGEHLDKALVSEVYLTDGKSEVKTAIIQQSDDKIQVKVPADAKPGRVRLMVLTTAVPPQFLEQPVSLVIEQ